MTLIGKAANQRDLRQRRLGMRQQMRSVLNPASANQFADRAPVVFVKLPRQVDVMHSRPAEAISAKAEPFQKSRFHDFRGLLQPAGDRAHVCLISTRAISARISKHQSLDGNRRRRVLARKLRIQAIGQPGDRQAIDLGRLRWNNRLARQLIQNRRSAADFQAAKFRLSISVECCTPAGRKRTPPGRQTNRSARSTVSRKEPSITKLIEASRLTRAANVFAAG